MMDRNVCGCSPKEDDFEPKPLSCEDFELKALSFRSLEEAPVYLDSFCLACMHHDCISQTMTLTQIALLVINSINGSQ